jgi:hypothetical protein
MSVIRWLANQRMKARKGNPHLREPEIDIPHSGTACKYFTVRLSKFQEAGWAPEPVWTSQKKNVLTLLGIEQRFLDYPARSLEAISIELFRLSSMGRYSDRTILFMCRSSSVNTVHLSGRLGGPGSLRSSEYQELVVKGWSGRGMKLTNRLYLVPTLRMCGATPP